MRLLNVVHYSSERSSILKKGVHFSSLKQILHSQIHFLLLTNHINTHSKQDLQSSNLLITELFKFSEENSKYFRKINRFDILQPIMSKATKPFLTCV